MEMGIIWLEMSIIWLGLDIIWQESDIPKQLFTRACLKIHSRRLHAPLRGIFGPDSVSVARYASIIGTKSPTKWDAQLTESSFQTHLGNAQAHDTENPDGNIQIHHHHDI